MTDELLATIDVADEESKMLTSFDNRYSPKTDYYLWKQWDTSHHYNTEEYIARLLIMEDGYDDLDDEFTLLMLMNKVIDEVLEQDDQELYRLV